MQVFFHIFTYCYFFIGEINLEILKRIKRLLLAILHFALRKQYNVIRIPDARHTSSAEFLVKLIQIDIGEQGRKISSLR